MCNVVTCDLFAAKLKHSDQDDDDDGKTTSFKNVFDLYAYVECIRTNSVEANSSGAAQPVNTNTTPALQT